MGQDPELTAMTQVADALSKLDERTITRVLKWASDRFNVSLKGAGKSVTGIGQDEEDGSNADFAHLPTLYDAANPTTEAEKALVVGYWFQEINGEENFETQSVNAKLKDLGHGIGNITRAFDALKNATPRLVHQVEKSGSTKQARKKFKLTVEGIRKIKSMVQQKANR